MLDRIAVPDGDVLVHAGDLTMRGQLEELTKFNQDLGQLPHKHKLICAGNHDFLFEREPSLARSLITNGTYLQDEEIIIEGKKFYLSPWQPWFYDWAFNLQRGADIQKKWDLIPTDTDVLVTHGPPYGILDEVQDQDWDGEMADSALTKRVHVGCSNLKKVINQIKPKLHVFGHIHTGYGVVKTEHTTFVNAAICTEQYKPTRKPIVIEL